MTDIKTSPDPEGLELEIKAKQKLNEATIGALILVSFLLLTACGVTSWIFISPLF